MTTFTFAQLHPSSDPCVTRNADLLGPRTLGVEVTDPTLARQCGLGNIDPQHSGREEDGRAAIEAGLVWDLPPAGARIVTIRPDADALGAMAVLLLRAGGHMFSPDSLARVAGIACWDRLARGSWRAWRRAHPPLFRPALAVDLMGKPLELKAVDALARLSQWSMARRVEALAGWLVQGKAALPSEAVQSALDFEAALLDAWNREAIEARPTDDPRIALLVAAPGAPLGGMDLAYRLAPVVIGEGHRPWGRKLTVAQFEPGWVDMPALLADLNVLEPGWGGQRESIIGSPQGAPSALALDHLYRLIQLRLRKA